MLDTHHNEHKEKFDSLVKSAGSPKVMSLHMVASSVVCLKNTTLCKHIGEVGDVFPVMKQIKMDSFYPHDDALYAVLEWVMKKMDLTEWLPDENDSDRFTKAVNIIVFATGISREDVVEGIYSIYDAKSYSFKLTPNNDVADIPSVYLKGRDTNKKHITGSILGKLE